MNVEGRTPKGEAFSCKTILTTEFGSLLEMKDLGLGKHETIKIRVSGSSGGRAMSTEVEAEVRYVERGKNDTVYVGLQYRNQTKECLETLILLSYCEPTLWEKLPEPDDSISQSAIELIGTPLRVLKGTQQLIESARLDQEMKQLEQEQLLQSEVN